MLGPVSPSFPQVPNAASEPAQAAQQVAPADDPRAGTGVETRRAARPIPDDGGQRGIEGAIAAKENTIRMTEEVARRDRQRLERYPAEMDGLRNKIASTGDPTERARLDETLGELTVSLEATKARLAAYETDWPGERAALEERIAADKTALAKAAYGQVPGTGGR